MKLFLDDLRNPPDDSWTVARSMEEAIAIVRANPTIEYMSLDHDLGDALCEEAGEGCEEPNRKDCVHRAAPTGMDFLKWVRDNDAWPVHKPNVHSANPVGAANMRNLIDDFGPYNRQ